MKTVLVIVAIIFVAGCTTTARAPKGILEQIEASELTAQQMSASVTNLTCTKYVAKKCAEPGKAFDATQGIALHDSIQRVRGALKTTLAIGEGQIGECLGTKRTQAGCLASAKAILAEVERRVLEQKGK